MDADTVTWLAIWLATGLAAFVGTAHIAATDDTFAEIRAWAHAHRSAHTTAGRRTP